MSQTPLAAAAAAVVPLAAVVGAVTKEKPTMRRNTNALIDPSISLGTQMGWPQWYQTPSSRVFSR